MENVFQGLYRRHEEILEGLDESDNVEGQLAELLAIRHIVANMPGRGDDPVALAIKVKLLSPDVVDALDGGQSHPMAVYLRAMADAAEKFLEGRL